MKILFANKRRLHPLGAGGDTVSIDLLFQYATSHGHICESLGVIYQPSYITSGGAIRNALRLINLDYSISSNIAPPYISISSKSMTKREIFIYRDAYLHTLVTNRYFGKTLEQKIADMKPDILVTQLEGTKETVLAAKKNDIPVIVFVHDATENTIHTLQYLDKNKNVVLVCVSEYLRTYLQKMGLWMKLHVVYPPLAVAKVRDHHSVHASHITMINPVKEKGAALLYKLVQKMSHHRFLIVEGWKKFEDIPYDYSKYTNAECIRYQKDISDVYEKTKVLIVPSLWEEAFGRVVTEAQQYGIPVIACNRGGLAEAVGEGGILISMHAKEDVWVHVIDMLLNDKQTYKNLSNAAKQNVQQFDIEKTGAQFLAICKDA